ncbi:MAG TPA: PilN domain-containing protein, partial [Gammaproteobacteria bacterium]|nr:PilN domain-containing protein [Gammaproteobacteria bacterium]
KARPGIVHLFDELVRTVPDGVYLTSITQNGKKLNITGVAESSARVSSYMRNIDASEWLSTPVLDVIETIEEGRTHSFTFALHTEQTSPKTDEELAEEQAMEGAP